MVKIRRVSDAVLAVVLALEEDMLRMICDNATKSGRSLEENCLFVMS